MLRNTSGTHLNTNTSSSPQLRTEGERWIEHRLVNRELCLPAQLSVNHTAALQLTLHPAAHQPSLMIKTLRHSSCVAGGSNSLPTRREPSTVLRQTTTASDSEVLTHPGSFKPSDQGPMKPTEPRQLPKARMHFSGSQTGRSSGFPLGCRRRSDEVTTLSESKTCLTLCREYRRSFSFTGSEEQTESTQRLYLLILSVFSHQTEREGLK